MRLVRFDDDGLARLGVLKDDAIVALDALVSRYPTMLAVIRGGDEALDQIRGYASAAEPVIDVKRAHLLAPIERPGKYLAIGMNYRKHVEEAARGGVSAPANQMWFNKQTTCISGPHDKIEPGVTEKLDYEVDLGVVIGKAAKSVSADHAHEHVFGYIVANDVSARDWQFHSPTFTMGKSLDTHGPIGPWIVTKDEIPDPHHLRLRCFFNGELRQDSNTGEMIHNVWAQIAYLSTAFTLEPGDLIATGTPEGVGIAMTPPKVLKSGDVVRCEVEGIGEIENTVA